ncbi:MAG: hypothetical protein M1150_03980 [Patescibacteria group bacterium]|nr:hypothetical protein [Patescibacteria group bacterium]
MAIGSPFEIIGFVSFIVVCLYHRSNKLALLALLTSLVAYGLGILLATSNLEVTRGIVQTKLISYLIFLAIFTLSKKKYVK